jgi:hypothetical protein
LKIKFLNNIKEFLDFLNENGEEGYKLIRDQIVPVISEMFSDKTNTKLIEKCSEALVEITKYIRDEDRGYHILTIVISKNKYSNKNK